MFMLKTLTVTLALIFTLSACSRKSSGEGVKAASNPPAPPAVRVAAVELRSIERAISATGSLLPDETVNLSFEAAGTVSRVAADFGQTVRKGQLIAELDRREPELQRERSRAALAQALARIGLEPSAQDPNPEWTPAIRQAQAQYEDARSKYESASKLVASGDISRERFVELEKTLRAREAALQASRDELRTQLAAIQGLRADLRLAEKRLSDTVLRAPFDGAIAARLASPGQYLRENAPVITLVKSTPLRLRVDVPEPAVGQMRAGTALSFTTEAAPGAVFRAVVRELNPALDAQSRSLTAEARLVNPDSRLKPGMFVQVRLVTARNVQVPAVPREAFYTVAGLTKLFVIRDGKAIEHRIQPGEPVGDRVTVPDVVRPGDRVAISNLPMLVNGLAVSVRGS
jgi:RND family efflux transporter MFP subunit